MACEDCTHKCLCIHSSLVLSSDGASFYKVMAGDFSFQLEIPAEFAGRMNFRACTDAILTGPSGHLWHVEFCCTDFSSSFRDGWQSFVFENRIKEKDILVFRHAFDIYFVVQVFGAIQLEQNASLHDDTSCGPKEGTLSSMQTEALAILNPMKSMEPPMFSVTLTKCATSKIFFLTIPKNFGDSWLPNKKVELSFVHHKNRGVWRHMLEKIRGGRNYGVHWKRFAIDNKLQQGDKCVFTLINRVKYVFMLYVNK